MLTVIPKTPGFLACLRRIRAMRSDPARIGDAALLQGQLLGIAMGTLAVDRVERLREARGDAVLRPRLVFAELQRMPPKSFGRALADFYEANRIRPATISDDFSDDDLRRAPALARYIPVHDLLHVLLGFDTSLAEEAGVSGFILGQGYFAAGRLVFLCSMVGSALLRPWDLLRIIRNARRGLALAGRARMLLGEPLEDALAEDLDRLRRRLGLADVIDEGRSAGRGR